MSESISIPVLSVASMYYYYCPKCRNQCQGADGNIPMQCPTCVKLERRELFKQVAVGTIHYWESDIDCGNSWSKRDAIEITEAILNAADEFEKEEEK